MFTNTWNHILDWFSDRSERDKLIRGFNRSARNAFISGEAPTMLKVCISSGCSDYRHQFSSWFNTGFRIQALSGKPLTKEEMKQLGTVVLHDDILVRRLIALGLDTLEVHDNMSTYGCRWKLTDYANIGGRMLNERN